MYIQEFSCVYSKKKELPNKQKTKVASFLRSQVSVKSCHCQSTFKIN